MAIANQDGAPCVRVRLTAVLAADGEVDEKIEYILQAGKDGEPTGRADMSRYDRSHIEVHYLAGAPRPADHISYDRVAVGRTLRAADWSSERESLAGLIAAVTEVLGSNEPVATIGGQLAGVVRPPFRCFLQGIRLSRSGRVELEGSSPADRDVLPVSRRSAASL